MKTDRKTKAASLLQKLGGEVPQSFYRGPKGEKGEKGDTGEKGEKGDAGKDGKDGRDGKDGVGKDGTSVSVDEVSKVILPQVLRKIPYGTGNMSRQINVNSSVAGQRYIDLNIVAPNATLANDDQKKLTVVTLPYTPIASATASTTDATTTTIATIAIPTDTTVMIEARVVARRTGGSAGSAQDGAGYIIAAAYKNVSGTATEIGETSMFSAEDQAGWSCSISPSGSNAVIQVTGAANNTISWSVTYSSYAISS